MSDEVFSTLEGNEVAQTGDPRFQTYFNTYDLTDNRNEEWRNSFISFCFGGKYIEDFGLNVVNLNNRRTIPASAKFTDITSSYDVLDGNFYWGTRLDGYQLSLDLATDGMTEVQLEDFKAWFSPGVIRSLRLAEHSGREISARISEPPNITVIPFEYTINQMLLGTMRPITTTLYKGEINISFIMDEPYWHNYYDVFIDTCTDETINMNKIILEDGIPHKSMFSIASPVIVSRTTNNYEEWKYAAPHMKKVYLNNIDNSDTDFNLSVYNAANINDNGTRYLYYCGSAPSAPKIKFTIEPIIDTIGENKLPYIIFPANSYTSPYNFNVLKIGDSQFKFTTPSLWTGYNEAIFLIDNLVVDNAPLESIRESFVENIHSPEALTYAVGCLAWLKENKSQCSVIDTASDDPTATLNWVTDEDTICPGSGAKIKMLELMRSFLVYTTTESSETVEHAYEGTFTFNFISGVMGGEITHRAFNAVFQVAIAGFAPINSILPFENSTIEDLTRTFTTKQNIGDMIRSGHLTIEGRKYFNTDTGLITPTECQVIRLYEGNINSSDARYSSIQLKNLIIDYKYMYY